MQSESKDALTRHELIQRSGMVAGALLLPEVATAGENDAPVGGTGVSELAAAPLPNGVMASWDRRLAYAEKTPTRERICLNGLWCWQPVREGGETVPAGSWGYFKVPGS